jgi:hypothetical protein
MMCFVACVSVMQKLMKVKASDKFSFPLSINLGPYLSPVDASLDAEVQVYDLQAILIHKGSSASQGHYGNGSLPPLHIAVSQLAGWTCDNRLDM